MSSERATNKNSLQEGRRAIRRVTTLFPRLRSAVLQSFAGQKEKKRLTNASTVPEEILKISDNIPPSGWRALSVHDVGEGCSWPG